MPSQQMLPLSFHAAWLVPNQVAELLFHHPSPAQNTNSITNASNILHYLFGEFRSKLEFFNKFPIVNCPIMITDGSSFYQSLLFLVVPRLGTEELFIIDILMVGRSEINDMDITTEPSKSRPQAAVTPGYNFMK